MIIDELFEGPQMCPECGGISFSDLILAEKKDACYYKVKASAKVWPSAYASGRLVQCRKKGAANYGKSKNEGVAEGIDTEELANEVYAEFERIYPNLARRADERTVHAAIMDVLNYGGDNNAGALAQDVARAVKQQMQQGMAEQQELDEKWSQKYKKSINCANPKGFSQRAHCAGRKKNEDVAEAGPSRRDPLDYPPLEGPGGSGAGGYTGGPSPFRGLFGRGKEAPVTEPKWSTTKIPGVDVHTGPPPTSKSASTNVKIDPAADVPAYIRKGLPDPVTTPVNKPKISVRPGETMDQAIQRTQTEKEFGRFLQGQSGQKFGAGAGRGGQGGPTAAQSTTDQVPTMTLPNGRVIPDPNALSPSGQYTAQSGSSRALDNVGDKEAYNAALQIRKNQWNQMKTGKEKEGEKRRSAWKNPETDVELEETSRKKREQPEVNYDDEYDAMVARVKKLAGLGPMKTVYDPAKRVYRNMPTAQQPQKK